MILDRTIFLVAIALMTLCTSRAMASEANSLQTMIDDAEPGATVIVPEGRYAPIQITKPLTLEGRGMPVIDGQGTGDVVRVTGATPVTIRGFVIRGSGIDLDRESTGVRIFKSQVTIENCRLEDVLFGIDLKQSHHCVIRNNHLSSKPLDIARRGDVIRLFRSDDCLIERNVIEDGRDALLWYSNRISVKDNVSRRNRYGFHAMYANDVSFTGNELVDNSVGIYLMYGEGFQMSQNRIRRNRGVSGFGIGLKEVDRYDIRDNLLVGNRVGVYLDSSPLRRRSGQATIVTNTFACNDTGMMLLPSVKGNRIVENNFIDNIEQIGIQGRGAVEQNEFTSIDTGRGNFWSDYTGFDANHDGVGDRTYASTKLFESLIDREPKLRLFLFSPAHSAIEFIGRAMPATRPEPKFKDAGPLMQPIASIHEPQNVPGAEQPRFMRMPLAAAILTLVALGITLCGLAERGVSIRKTSSNFHRSSIQTGGVR